MSEKDSRVSKASKVSKDSPAARSARPGPALPEKEIEELEAKCEEYLAGWKRALADYDNLKRDLGRERDEIRRYALERAAEGFLGVLEHFDQAMKHEPDLSSCDEEVRKKISSWLSGIVHIRTAMAEELKTLGLEPIEPEVGSAFDPERQESVGSREEGASDRVLEIVSRGWKLQGRLLRPPRVIISS